MTIPYNFEPAVAAECHYGTDDNGKCIQLRDVRIPVQTYVSLIPNFRKLILNASTRYIDQHPIGLSALLSLVFCCWCSYAAFVCFAKDARLDGCI